jgi:hypothetical protein
MKRTCGLIDQRQVGGTTARIFFGIAAQMMRRVLVDHARSRKADKRGSGEAAVVLDEALEIRERSRMSMSSPSMKRWRRWRHSMRAGAYRGAAFLWRPQH